MTPKQSNTEQTALYARVSGDRQEKEQSIDTQLFKLHERVQAEHIAVYQEYLDIPYTGTVINRPALDRLMDDARKGLFNRVLIYDPDRLSHGKPWMRGYLEEQLARAGVAVTYLSYQVEDTKEGRAKDGMISVFAEWERETLVQRMNDGRERRMREGHIWRGPRPFGWRYLPARDGHKYGHMEIVPEEGAVVRQVFDWTLEGRTTHWTATTVNRIIHNPIHSGQPAINRYKAIEPATPKKQYRRAHVRSSNTQRPQGEWVRVTLPLAIVTPEQQAAAEERLLLNRKRSTRNTKRPYLLSGLCRCGWDRHHEPGVPCGHMLTGRATNANHTRFHYRCNRQYPATERFITCCKGAIGTDLVEQAVWTHVTALLRQPEILLAQMELASAEGDGSRQRLEVEMTAASEALGPIQARLKALLEKNLAGVVDDDTFRAVQADLVAQRDMALQRLASAEAALATAGRQQARWTDVRVFCDAVVGRLAELEQPEHFTRKQELVRTLVTTAWVYPDHLSIEGVLPVVSSDVTVTPTP